MSAKCINFKVQKGTPSWWWNQPNLKNITVVNMEIGMNIEKWNHHLEYTQYAMIQLIRLKKSDTLLVVTSLNHVLIVCVNKETMHSTNHLAKLEIPWNYGVIPVIQKENLAFQVLSFDVTAQ